LGSAPHFVDPGFDLALTANSPGVDAGDNLAVDAAAYSFGGGRRFIDSVNAADTGVGTGPIVDMGAYEYSSLEARYGCTAVGNSTGQSALIRASGSNEVSLNLLRLSADSLPLNQFGYFLASRNTGLVTLAGNSGAHLCLGGSIGRLNRFGEVGNSSSTGSFTEGIDLGSIPQGLGSTAVVPGETWYFQAWFRDSDAGAGRSNFTDRVAIDFD
ncbi:MAG: hypothetical protein P1V35_16170, partial [Planctomycetota bacterium]|nr:hypothetical protein [Planctomycetota bacterium]